MNADMLNRGTEDRPSLSLSLSLSFFLRVGGRTSPPPPSVSATEYNGQKKIDKRANNDLQNITP